jgi:hypothetical protein
MPLSRTTAMLAIPAIIAAAAAAPHPAAAGAAVTPEKPLKLFDRRAKALLFIAEIMYDL